MKGQGRGSPKSLLPLMLLAFFVTSGFRAGSAKVDITPDTQQWLVGYYARQSKGVHDRPYHRIVVMEDDSQNLLSPRPVRQRAGHRIVVMEDDSQNQFVLISSDLCTFDVLFYEQLCRELEQETGIKQNQVWWAVTHTHSGPESGDVSLYRAFMPERLTHEIDQAYAQKIRRLLIDGVKKAREGLVPARIGIGTGVSFANMNRRAIDVDGTATLGLNPEAPVDRQIGLLRVERLDGSPIALVASYAMHGTAMSALNLETSGDALGIVAEYVEEKVGAPMLYINGAAGNVASFYYFQPNPRAAHLGQFRVLLGDRIIDANRSIRADGGSQVRFWTGQITVETPLREKLAWPDALSSYLRRTGGGMGLVREQARCLRCQGPLPLPCSLHVSLKRARGLDTTLFRSAVALTPHSEREWCQSRGLASEIRVRISLCRRTSQKTFRAICPNSCAIYRPLVCTSTLTPTSIQVIIQPHGRPLRVEALPRTQGHAHFRCRGGFHHPLVGWDCTRESGYSPPLQLAPAW
ncbi:MAG: neutral/alkaline non-lysosomal ceramidase N-terminal domain-containing protein [Acidobacteriota bacterium]